MARQTMAEYARSNGLEAGDYFSAACGLYWYCVDYHGGQWSDLYRIQCQLNYHPGLTERGPEPGTVDSDIYAALEAGTLDAEEVLSWIQAQYAATHE